MQKAFLSSMLALFLVAAPGLQADPVDGEATDEIRAMVIDLSCKVVHDLSGEDHRECAQVCADQGVPLAFLAEDGTIYHPVSQQMPSSGDEINAQLREHAERNVVVEGQIVERGGSQGIIIENVRAEEQ